jgi:hypothetical protein
MATSSNTGKLPRSPKPAKPARIPEPSAVDPDFAGRWDATDKSERRRIRRLVRSGRPQKTEADARAAVGFAAYQRTRPWYRFFWLWFVPVVIGGLGASFAAPPIVIGIVVGVFVNALLIRRAFRRTDMVNAPVLGGTASA